VLSHNHEGKYSKNARYTYQHSRDPEISHNIRDSRCGRRRNEQAGILLAKRTIVRELQKPTDNSTLLYEHNDLRRDQCESLSLSHVRNIVAFVEITTQRRCHNTSKFPLPKNNICAASDTLQVHFLVNGQVHKNATMT